MVEPSVARDVPCGSWAACCCGVWAAAVPAPELLPFLLGAAWTLLPSRRRRRKEIRGERMVNILILCFEKIMDQPREKGREDEDTKA